MKRNIYQYIKGSLPYFDEKSSIEELKQLGKTAIGMNAIIDE
jgi:hypothetical protein